MRRRRASGGSNDGQALVEFAFAFPVLLVLMMAIIDFGRLSFTYISLASSATELARKLSVPGTSAGDAIAAFNAGNVASAGTHRPSDGVRMTVYDVFGKPQGTTSCGLPLQVTTCQVPGRVDANEAPYLGGYVTVGAEYTFIFMPALGGPLGIGYWEPSYPLRVQVATSIG